MARKKLNARTIHLLDTGQANADQVIDVLLETLHAPEARNLTRTERLYGITMLLFNIPGIGNVDALTGTLATAVMRLDDTSVPTQCVCQVSSRDRMRCRAEDEHGVPHAYLNGGADEWAV